MIDFTTKCNLNCVYCLRHFENKGKSIEKKVLYDICNYIINYCKKYKINNISFQPWGGEPLIEIDKIIDSKKIFEDAGIKVDYTIQTNGLLLSEENYIKLQANGIGFGISLDGNKKAHDSHRVDLKGNKTFDELMSRLKKIRDIDSQCKFSTLSVNSKYTLEHIEESIRYLVEEQGIEFLKFNLVHPNGKNFDWNMLIEKEDIKKFAIRLFNAIVSENRRGYTATEANIKTKILNIINQSENDLCHTNGCRGGRKFISFSQEGNIYPCEMIGSEINCIGNIYDGKDLADLVKKALTTKPFFKEKKNEKCNKCPYYAFCKGGCTASAMAYNKKNGEIDDMECNFNLSIYPLIIELILKEPELAEKIAGRKMRLL